MTSSDNYLLVNAHIHTPWSFSAFDSIAQATAQAREQQVAVLGISDFNTVDGFVEFERCCADAKVYPLYNIEFIALEITDQKAGIRWNDPKNPGIMYLCGKALAHPVAFSQESLARIDALNQATAEHLTRLTAKLNEYCASVNVHCRLSYETMLKRYAKKSLRERHILRALYETMLAQYPAQDDLVSAFRRLFNDASFNADVRAAAAMQDQIRAKLFKAGQPVYVQEQTSAFLSPEKIKQIILDGQGIPCYPVMVDDSTTLNERESNCEALADELMARGFFAVEFIPLRNSLEILTRYVAVFKKRGFCITFGTEHNTPKNISLVPACRAGVALSPELEQINYEGACILAAHQNLRKNKSAGFVDDQGNRTAENLSDLIKLGDSLIRAGTHL